MSFSNTTAFLQVCSCSPSCLPQIFLLIDLKIAADLGLITLELKPTNMNAHLKTLQATFFSRSKPLCLLHTEYNDLLDEV